MKKNYLTIRKERLTAEITLDICYSKILTFNKEQRINPLNTTKDLITWLIPSSFK